MTEVEEINNDELFSQMTTTKILIGILETEKEVSISRDVLIKSGNEDKELQVDYNSDNQMFTFKLRDKGIKQDDNN